MKRREDRKWITRIFNVVYACAAIELIGVSTQAQAISPDTGAGPVRLARVSYVSGSVSYRTTESADWSAPVRNLPLRQGAELTAPGTGLMEIQFDDGSRLRLGDDAVATLSIMYSDSKGEYTQIELRGGEAALRLVKAPSVYEVDTPTASVDVNGPARIWMDTSSGLRTSVLKGSAVVQGKGGKATLAANYSMDLRQPTDPYVTQPLPTPDSFDRWCITMDSREDHDLRVPQRSYEPAQVAIMSDNLADYGTWRSDPRYGRVWHPHHTYAGWRPYHDGHWVWTDPYGWTWVGAEPWGWAPYHYGSWIDEPWGWAWYPGPAVQYWSPAVVDFSCYGANIAWCPLAPAECVYPAAGISIGFGGPNWWFSFGIGACAVWYPGPGGFAGPMHGILDTAIDLFMVAVEFFVAGFNHNGFAPTRGYVPVNARGFAGATVASTAAFGGRGAYRSLPAGSTSAFRNGSLVGAPGRGGVPTSGPSSVRPSVASTTATRSLSHDPPASVSRAALTRSVNRTANNAQSPTAARQAVAQRPAAARTVAGSTAGARSPAVNGAPRNVTGRSPAAAPSRAQVAANQARSRLGMPQSSIRSASSVSSRTPNRTTAAARTSTAALHAAVARSTHPSSGRQVAQNRRTGTSRTSVSHSSAVRFASTNAQRARSTSPARTASVTHRTSGISASIPRRSAGAGIAHSSGNGSRSTFGGFGPPRNIGGGSHSPLGVGRPGHSPVSGGSHSAPIRGGGGTQRRR